MFNTVLTALRGAFTRAFWFGSFLPVAVAAAIHFLLIALVFPGLLPLEAWLSETLGQQATIAMLIIVGLILLAYCLTPMVPLVRGFLDGQLMPLWLHDWLRDRRIHVWRRASNQMRRALGDFGAFNRLQEQIPDLWDAAAAGNAGGGVNDPALIHIAGQAVAQAQTELLANRLPQRSSARQAFADLATALRRNATNLPPGSPGGGEAEQLAAARDAFVELIRESRAEASYRARRLVANYAGMDVLPTRIGAARLLAERYSEDTYGVDFDFLWPRIQLFLPANNDGFSQRLQDAQSQVNFSVLALVLTLTVPVGWLPILLFTSTTPWLFLGVGLLSPPVVIFFYELVVQSQSVFGETVRVAIDKYRLDVLTQTMLQPKPATLSAERILWTGLLRASEPGNNVDLTYVHKAGS